ncbi:TnpV protein [Clostridium sp. AF17-2]|uniref:TnpV protein n=2 Tax=unclassified Clostridium TaxID=2614128 RepID=UPI000E53C85E|nr:TnpV protein [Clostridium sp. AF17-2]RGG77391.1 TnpV protein [Clostridium sp. AF17-21AC]RHR58165.1 TnpV protein [Clostridium sp. AF17-2]
MNIMYEKNGDYLIPNIVANLEPEGELRKFGLMRQSYLKEWHKGIYTGMVLNGTLMKHLLAVQERSEKAFDQLVEQMARVESVTEELKAADQMEWVRRMNNIRMRAEEIVREQIIYRV